MKNDPKWAAFIILFCVPLTGASIDIYVPSLPAIQQAFSVPASSVQLSLTTYLIGFGCFQLIVGSLSDFIGRRWLFMLGLFMYVLTSFLIIWSHNITTLLGLRFLQGVSVAAIAVTGIAMIPDLFTGKLYTRYMNYSNLAWALSPVLAPYIGGYLQDWFGWQASFYFLTGYGLLGFILACFFIWETHTERCPFQLRTIINNYITLLKDKRFLVCLFFLSLIYGSIVIFNVVGPFL